MADATLADILNEVHEDMKGTLERARKAFSHPGTKGDASENAWLELFEKYLPRRYQAQKAQVVDSNGQFSQQIDVVIFDRQYSPFIFDFQGKKIVPAESVYAVFEAKQTIDADKVRYAREKIESVRRLHRTSLPIPHAGGVYPAKALTHIYGGILTLDSEWSPALQPTLLEHLQKGDRIDRLDLGCVAAHGYFYHDKTDYHIVDSSRSAAEFLFKLIAELQFNGTVPMIDVLAYSKWLTKTP